MPSNYKFDNYHVQKIIDTYSKQDILNFINKLSTFYDLNIPAYRPKWANVVIKTYYRLFSIEDTTSGNEKSNIKKKIKFKRKINKTFKFKINIYSIIDEEEIFI